MFGRALVCAGFALVLSAAMVIAQGPIQDRPDVNNDQSDTTGYVGSRACSKCHQQIYRSYSRTDMGRSMSQPSLSLLNKFPTSVTVFDSASKRHFEVSVRDGQLFQSEFERGMMERRSFVT